MRIQIALLPAAIAALLLSASAVAAFEKPKRSPGYVSLTKQFSAFADKTASMPREERVALFRKELGPLFPDFYEPSKGQSEAEFNASVAAALEHFPTVRADYEQAERGFPHAFNTAMKHFRKTFPGFPPATPIWFLHSLNQMDGGVREFEGRTQMIFGADLIGKYHSDESLETFLTHELFHLENRRWFNGCNEQTIWCSLWVEGGATYASAVLTPNVTDHMLMLDVPAPIRPAVDAEWRNVICKVAADLERSDEATYGSYFLMGKPQAFPSRWGYYVGYRMMQRIGTKRTLLQIDHTDSDTAHMLVKREIEAMAKEAGGCASG